MKAYFSSCCLIVALSLLMAACNRSNLAGAPSAVTPTSSTPTSTPVSSQDLEASFRGCPAPCWAGIELGGTSGDIARQRLADRYGEDTITVENYTGRYFLEWAVAPADISQSGRIEVRENEVTFVALQVDAGAVTVETLVGALGEPAFVNVAFSTDPPDDCAVMTLIFPEPGLTVYLTPFDDSKGVFERQQVASLNFVDIRDNNEFWKWADTSTLAWDGYQDYCAGR